MIGLLVYVISGGDPLLRRPDAYARAGRLGYSAWLLV